MEQYIYELLVIDKEGDAEITKDDSLFRGLLFSESLWQDAKEISTGDTRKIVDESLKIELRFQAVDTSKALNDLIESAFIIKIKGGDFESMESFRYTFLQHLKSRLKFNNIRILRDDISTEISNKIYPSINRVENLLRRYVVKFFIQKIGVEWWTVTVPKTIVDKVNLRRGNERVFSKIVDTDVTLMDFDDLGELIYKQTTGFNTQENVINKIREITSLDELELLKQEVLGNYTKYFKEAFQENNFDKKWKKLFEIRNKVAHNNFFVKEDLSDAQRISEEITQIIDTAESKIEEFKFSVEEQEAIRKATIEAVKAEDNTEINLVVDNIDGPEESSSENESQLGFFSQFITENAFLSELALAQKTAPQRNLKYVGLKSFVSNILVKKGYAYGPTFSLANILRDRGKIEIYEAEDGAKAIRLIDARELREKVLKSAGSNKDDTLIYLNFLRDNRNIINFQSEIPTLKILAKHLSSVSEHDVTIDIVSGFTFAISQLQHKSIEIDYLEKALINLIKNFPQLDYTFKTLGVFYLEKGKMEKNDGAKIVFLEQAIVNFQKGDRISGETKLAYKKYICVCNREMLTALESAGGKSERYYERLHITKNLFETNINYAIRYPEFIKEYAIFLYLHDTISNASIQDKRATELFSSKYQNASAYVQLDIEKELGELERIRKVYLN